MKVINLLFGASKNRESIEAISYYSDIFNQLGAEVTSIVNPECNSIKELVKLPINLKTFKFSPWNKLFEKNKLKAFLANFKADLIVVYDEYSYNQISFLQNVPVIFFLGENIKKQVYCDGAIYSDIQKWNKYKDKIKLQIPNRKYYLPIEYSFIYRNPNISKIEKEIITFGVNICENFDHDMNFICKVFSLVCNNFQNFQIKILNQFENKNSLEELVRHYKLENYVIINEDVSEFEKFIDDLDFYLTAPYENVNTKEINNVALKKIPVIVPNLEFLNEIIVHGLNGFFYEKADLNSFIMLVEKILQYTTYHSDKICKDFINVNHLNYLKKVYHILEELTLHDFEVL